MNREELDAHYHRHKAKRMTGSMTRAAPSVSPLPLSREPRPDAGHLIRSAFRARRRHECNRPTVEHVR